MISKMEYDCDGSGSFSLRYLDKEGNVVGLPQTGLSFFDVYLFQEITRSFFGFGKKVPSIRIEGLAKKLTEEEWSKRTMKINSGEAD